MIQRKLRKPAALNCHTRVEKATPGPHPYNRAAEAWKHPLESPVYLVWLIRQLNRKGPQRIAEGLGCSGGGTRSRDLTIMSRAL